MCTSRSRKRLLVVAGHRSEGAQGCTSHSPERASHRGALHQAGKCIRSVAPRNRRRHELVPCWPYPGHTAMNFRRETKSPVLGDIVHAVRVQFSIQRSPRCSTPTSLRLRRRGIIAAEARERGCVDRGAAHEFPGLGRLHREGVGIAGRRWYLPINEQAVNLTAK